ncbi:MAG: hypothetical protein FJ049_00360 [Cyanobacteria bacterium M_surface_7_m2_037]|nr:hypothetical protein [Cyanobacteria bacterium M_surface_7_m2_037]
MDEDVAFSGRGTPKLTPRDTGQMTGTERQRQNLIESLRVRFAKAVADNDADAKAALFKEAVYLGIQPDAFTGSDLDQTA